MLWFLKWVSPYNRGVLSERQQTSICAVLAR